MEVKPFPNTLELNLDEPPMPKYLVYKCGPDGDTGDEILDAVVIRRQDIFAAPALEAYANAITCVIDGLLAAGTSHNVDLAALRDIADYFHDQAERSYDSPRKLPD